MAGVGFKFHKINICVAARSKQQDAKYQENHK